MEKLSLKKQEQLKSEFRKANLKIIFNILKNENSINQYVVSGYRRWSKCTDYSEFILNVFNILNVKHYTKENLALKKGKHAEKYVLNSRTAKRVYSAISNFL